LDDLNDGIESSNSRDQQMQQQNNPFQFQQNQMPQMQQPQQPPQQNNPFQFQQNQMPQMQQPQQPPQQNNPFQFQQNQMPQMQQPQQMNNMNMNNNMNNPFNFQQMPQPQQMNNMNLNNNQNPFGNFQQNMNMNNNNNNYSNSSFSRKTATKTKVRGANTNVIGLELGKLGESAVVATGDAQYCENCKAMFNSLSVLNKQEENTNSNVEDKKWKCEFCSHLNSLMIEEEEIPKVDTLDYLLEPAPQMEEKTGDNNTILFVVDISGSMCVKNLEKFFIKFFIFLKNRLPLRLMEKLL
jgi:hypothetical protein